ncbi:lipopolysaccharide biosynthesis protein [Bifidobacterium gallicum]|uniref:Polysaccharide biosynthesis protein n=1 Tax=Bifidobacterium gallicum DSM 20093 = LMG 11596 TaxID=561180 RepID=D1NRT7_9BIFI|nr:oligosaccharide flippase family protein [Bifidobacterium gallicum]EFA23926.1 polysaccharide biosynthesis protein [Bifidobacterium gallicum DSM 20093 = LMG 11596]KFI59097.1 polysaccharide biosynthesis protein [Bifidobacterium gallicum DSM 20093 = LMG 11596]
MSKYGNLLKNIGLFTISNIALKLITFILIPLYTYYLTTAEYGLTDMLNTVMWIATPVFSLSVSDAVLRYCIEAKGNKLQQSSYVTIGFTVVALSCVLAAVCIPVLDLPFFGGLGDYKLWYILCFATLSFNNFFSNVARGLDQVTLMAVSSVFSSLTNIGVGVLTIAFMGMGINGFFLSMVLGYSVGCLTYVLGGHPLALLRFQALKQRAMYKTLFLYSLPLIPNTLFWWASQCINRFFITGMLGIGASGLFAAASKIPSFLNMVSGIFLQAWNLSAFQESESKERERFFNNIYQLFNFAVLLCAVILIPASPFIAKFLFQKDFYQAWLLAPVLLVSFYYGSLSAFYGSLYTASLKTKALFTTTLYGAVTCVIGTWILVQTVGLQGAGIASAISNVVVWLTRMVDSKHIITITVHPLPAIGVAAFLVTSTVFIVMPWGVWAVVLSAASALIAAAVQFAVSKNAVLNIREFLKTAINARK